MSTIRKNLSTIRRKQEYYTKNSSQHTGFCALPNVSLVTIGVYCVYKRFKVRSCVFVLKRRLHAKIEALAGYCEAISERACDAKSFVRRKRWRRLIFSQGNGTVFDCSRSIVHRGNSPQHMNFRAPSSVSFITIGVYCVYKRFKVPSCGLILKRHLHANLNRFSRPLRGY